MKLFIFLTILTILPSIVFGASYTVTPSTTTVWFSHLSDLQPGDVLTFAPQTPGAAYTYVINKGNSWILNGNAQAPIIVQGQAGERITIEQQSAQHNVMDVTGTHFIVRNLALTSQVSGVVGLRLIGPNSVTHALVDHITVHDIKSNAITANSPDVLYDNVTISNCEVYNTGETGECIYAGCQPKPTPSSSTVCQFINGALINNYCHDTCVPDGCTGGSEGSGFQIKGWGSHSNLIRRNVCKNVNKVCILLYDDFDLGPNIVQENWIYNNKGDAGIQVSAGAVISNNIIYNNAGPGIAVTTNTFNLRPDFQNRKIVIEGNTIVNNNVGISIPVLNPTTGSRVQNNAVIQDSGNAFSGGDQTGVTWLSNAYHGGSLPGGVAAAGGFTVDTASSVLVAPSTFNFHPKSNSVLLAAGAQLASSDVPYDFDFNMRDACHPSVGAYESTGSGSLPLGFLPAASGGATPCGGAGEIACSSSCSSTSPTSTKATTTSGIAGSTTSTTGVAGSTTSTKATTTKIVTSTTTHQTSSASFLQYFGLLNLLLITLIYFF